MGWIGKFGHFVTNSVVAGVRNLGHLGGEALKKVGVFKHAYDNINHSFGGMIGKSIAGLPMPTVNDEIALQLTQLIANTEYQLKVDATNFSVNGIEAYIHDAVNKTDVSATKGLTIIPISNAISNRFSLVFKPATVIASTVMKGTVNIYPNPVTNKVFTLQTTNLVKGTYQLKLMNSQGQEIITSIINHPGGYATNTISTSQLPSGMYMLNLVGEGSSYKTEFIVK